MRQADNIVVREGLRNGLESNVAQREVASIPTTHFQANGVRLLGRVT